MINYKEWATPLTIGSFVVTGLTGILIFFHLDIGLIKPAQPFMRRFDQPNIQMEKFRMPVSPVTTNNPIVRGVAHSLSLIIFFVVENYANRRQVTAE